PRSPPSRAPTDTGRRDPTGTARRPYGTPRGRHGRAPAHSMTPWTRIVLERLQRWGCLRGHPATPPPTPGPRAAGPSPCAAGRPYTRTPPAARQGGTPATPSSSADDPHSVHTAPMREPGSTAKAARPGRRRSPEARPGATRRLLRETCGRPGPAGAPPAAGRV